MYSFIFVRYDKMMHQYNMAHHLIMSLKSMSRVWRDTYIYWRGSDLIVYNYFVLYFWIEMNSSWKLFSFINFVSTSIWKWHGIIMHSIYCIEESNASFKELCYVILVFKEKHHYCGTSFYRVFITEKSTNHIINNPNKYLL